MAESLDRQNDTFPPPKPSNMSSISKMTDNSSSCAPREIQQMPTKSAIVVKAEQKSMQRYHTTHVPGTKESCDPVLTSTDDSKSSNQEKPEKKKPSCFRHDPDSALRSRHNESDMELLQADLSSLARNDQEIISRMWALFSNAPGAHRKLMLQGMLTQACSTDLQLLNRRVTELLKVDIIGLLPVEVSSMILMHLDPLSLCKAMVVSKTWRSRCDDDQVWRHLVEQHEGKICQGCGFSLPTMKGLLPHSKTRFTGLEEVALSQHQHELSHAHEHEAIECGTDVNVANPRKRAATTDLVSPRNKRSVQYPTFPRLTWKDTYVRGHRIGQNWRKGRAKASTLKGHTDGILCLQMDDQVLMTGSYDKTVKIWDMRTLSEMATLRDVGQDGVRSIAFDSKKIIVGSIDGQLSVFDRRTGRMTRRNRGYHRGAIASIFIDGDRVATGGADGVIAVCCLQNKTRYELMGHVNWVNAVHIDSASNTLLSAGDEGSVILWDLITRRPLRVLEGHTAQVQSLAVLPPDFEPSAKQVEDLEADQLCSSFEYQAQDLVRPLPPRYIVTSCLDGGVKLWDVHHGKALHDYLGHLNGVWGVVADNTRVVSVAEDSLVKIWQPRSGECMRTLMRHHGAVTCVGMTSTTMVTAGLDHTIRVYGFNATEAEIMGSDNEGEVGREGNWHDQTSHED